MKTAIIYSTKYGTAGTVAETIREGLKDGADIFNIKDAKKIKIDAYEQIVLGGSVYIGKTQKELTAFAEANLDKLLTKKVALYLCAGRPEREALEQELQLAYPATLLDKAVYKGTVGSAIDLKKLNILERAVVKKVMGLEEGYIKLDKDAIESLIKVLS